MDEDPEPNEKSKWPKRLGFLFLFVFAIVWSLGPFFFWVPLSLSGYFFFLHFYQSSRILDSIREAFTSFGKRPPPTNPYQSFRPRSSTPTGKEISFNPQKVIRGIVIGFVALFFFFFLIGLFFGGDESAPQEEIQITETPAEDDGTTYWNEKGNAALQNDLRDSALYYYDRALAIDPENMYALYNKGLAYILRQEYRRGNGLARRCLTYHPDYDPAWWLLGYSYDLTNETDSSLYCLEQAYQHDYAEPDFLQLLAEVYVKKGRRPEALAVYQKVIGMDSTKVDIYKKMAELDPGNAEQYLRKARALEN
ncbi:MAG: hypothetical protein JNN04_15440 [Cyclobacteriaceae bacterium]|nr:hypothetical protein [Cyclobacteriaceae bacterium]